MPSSGNKSPKGSAASKGAKHRGRPGFTTAAPLNHEQRRIQKWLRQVHFQRALFGGLREADVWKKLGELNALYEAALSAERARYDALLEEERSRSYEDYERAGDEDYS